MRKSIVLILEHFEYTHISFEIFAIYVLILSFVVNVLLCMFGQFGVKKSIREVKGV